MKIGKLCKRALAAALAAAMLMSGNVSMAAEAVGQGKAKERQEEAELQEKLKETIRDSDELAEQYPQGLFNFLGTQYETKEGKEYIEIAVIRQGGTQGEASVRFRAIDITAAYGDDYEIYTSKKKKSSAKVEKGEDAAPLIQFAYDKETDISDADAEEVVEKAVEKETKKAEKKAAKAAEKAEKKAKKDAKAKNELQKQSLSDESLSTTGSAVQAEEKTPGTVQPSKAISEVSASSLKEAKSAATGMESDRKDWEVVAADSGDEAEAREQYDAFLSNAGGSETELTFEDGEYIQYLYLYPKDDDVAEAEEQLIMALLQKDGNPEVGGSYSAYVNIKDNDGAEKTTYEFAQSEVSTDKDKVSVTVRRTSGIGYNDTVYVGTAEGSANSGADYVAGLKKLNFFSGQTEQKVSIDILDNEYREKDRDFYLLLSIDGENYEDASCHVTIEGNGEGTMKAQATSSNAEKITSNGWYSGTPGVWRMGGNDFKDKDGFSLSSENMSHSYTGAAKKQTYVKNGFYLYGINTIRYDYKNNGTGKTTTWTEKKSKINLRWKYRWKFREYWTVTHTSHEDNFYFTMGGQKTTGPVNKTTTRTINVTRSQWSGGIDAESYAAAGNNTQPSVTNIRLEAQPYTYQFKKPKDTFYTVTYTLSNDKKDTLGSGSKKDITPSLSLDSLRSNLGNSKNTNKLYRSDALTFKLNNWNSNVLTFNGIEASTDNTNWTKVSNSLDLVLNIDFFKTMNLAGRGTNLFFRPVFSYKNANVKFTLENESKGTYTNLNKNFTTGSNPQLHIGDTIKNIVGKSGNAASYQPSFATKKGANESAASKTAYASAGANGLSLDSGNSQGAVANLTLQDAYTEVRLAYANPSVTVQADPNTYRNTIANQVISVDGKEYKCDNTKQLEELHTVMEEKFKNNTDAQIKLTFEYQHNPLYMNGTVTSDSEFGTPRSAVLNIYKENGTPDKTYTAQPVVIQRNGKDVYTFTYEGSWKEMGFEAGSVATVTVNGKNGMTSQETEIDFLDQSASYVMAVAAEGGIMKDKNGNEIGSIRTPLTFTNMNPMVSYNYVATPSNNFVGQWADYSLDVNNDGNVSNAKDDNEVKKAEKRLEELGQDTSLANMNPEVYIGNSFVYQPSYYAQSKVYYDFVKRNTSTGNNNRVGLQLIERKATVLEPGIYEETPLENAVVTLPGSVIAEKGEEGNYFDKGAYEKGRNYLADVFYKGIHFQARCVATRTITQEINTSDVMYPVNFNVQKNGADTGVQSGGNVSYLDVENKAGTTHTFTFSFKSSVGVKPNKAKIILYNNKTKQEFWSTTIERKNVEDLFKVDIDLAEAGAKPYMSMLIQGVYNDGKAEYSYPTVDTGIIFKQKLTALSVAGSFKTGFTKTLKVLGNIATQFDLPLDYDLGALGTEPVEYRDDDGSTHQVTQIAFGYNTEVKEELKKIQTDYKAENKGNAMSGRSVVTKYIKNIMENGVIGEKDDEESEEGGNQGTSDNAEVNEANANAKSAQNPDGAGAQESNMGNASFDFGFSVAVILTVETGPSKDLDTRGANFFDSLMLVAAGEARFEDSVVYTTPIGIDIVVEVKAGGKAVAAFAAASSTKNPYGKEFNLNKNEDADDTEFTLTKDDFDIYTKFLLAPTLTLGAGVGLGGGKIFKVTISGTADFDFKFTAPIIGTDTVSQGSGEVTLGIDLELKILFIKKKWTLYKSDEMNLFSYGTQGIGDMLEDFQENYLYDAIEAEDLETVSRDYLKNRSEWQPYDMSAKKVEAGAEKILEDGVYPYPDAKLLDLGDNKVLAVFLDDPGTEAGYDAANNAVTMYSYSTDGGTNWTTPQIIDDDKTEDESPYVYKVTDDKALVVWSDASDKLSNVDEGKTLQENLGKMDITGAWFDCKTGKMGEPVTVAWTSTEEDSGDIRTDYADTAPMISYDEDTKRLMVYYTATDYEDDKISSDTAGKDLDDASQEKEAVTYGDILNGYSATAFTTATMDANGEFSAFDDEPGFVNLAVPPINKGEKIVDPKVVDGDVISYNGLALHAYTIDKDQNDQTLGDRELFMQIYNYSGNDGKGEFHYPIQITNDSVEDGNPQFARARNMTYLYWISDGDVKYINITSLVKELQANDIKSEADNGSHDGFLQYCEEKVADNPDTAGVDESTTLGLYYIKGDPTYIAVAHKVETDENGKVVGEQPITDFDIESNGKTMYMLWTDIVTEAKDPNETGAENVIKETQVFGAYCEPNMELTESKETYTFESNDSIKYKFAEGKDETTYPVSYTINEQLEETEETDETDKTTPPEVGKEVKIDYTTEADLNGEVGKVKAGDPAVRKVQTIVTDGSCGWSDPIQITRKTGEEYNYDDLSFRVTDDNTVQAIFSRGPQTLNADGAFEVDEAHRKLAVQNFVITSTLEKSEMTYRRVSDEADAETDTTAAGEAQTKETGNSTASDTNEKEGEGYCYPGDTVEYSVSLTNDGFKPLEDIQYRTYVTKDGKEVSDEVSKEWKEVAPDVYQTSELSLDVYTDEDKAEVAADPLTKAGEEQTVNRLLGGKTVTLSGRTTLGEDIEGTGFVIELKYKENGKEKIEKIERDLLVEPNVTVTAGQTELIDKDTANVKVTVANSGNKEYTGDIRLKDGDTKLSEEKDVTVAPGETSSYVMEVDISKCKFGKLQDNADGSKQDSLKLDVVYGSGDDKVENVAEIVRSTSVEGGQAVDAIKSIDIGVKTSSNETEPSKISGSYYNIGQNQVISLESMFTVDENSEGAKALAKDGNSAEAQMITEWKSSDPDVAFISDKGAVVPMSEGTTEITAIVYPGQKDQVGVAAVTGDSEASDSQGNESAGRGGYMTSSGKYKVPEDLITKKTITLTVGNPSSSTPVVTPTEDPGKDEPSEDPGKDEPTVTPGDDEPSDNPTDEPSDNPSDDDKEPSGGSNNSGSSSGDTVKVGTTKVVKKVEYEVQPGKTSVAVSDVKKDVTKVVIPASIKIKGKKYKVTKIKANAFKNHKKLKTIVIGKNIKKIGKKAFYNDGQAVKIVFKGKKPPKIGKKAFAKISKYAVFKVPKGSKRKYRKVLKKRIGVKKTHKIKWIKKKKK